MNTFGKWERHGGIYMRNEKNPGLPQKSRPTGGFRG